MSEAIQTLGKRPHATALKQAPPGRRVGLALGGGAARGAAHLGVLLTLQRAGIPVDVVTGTSVGAFVGAFYCAGLPIEEMQQIATDLQWRHLVRPAWSRHGLLSFANMERFLVRHLGDRHFDDLPIPFAVMAADLETGKPLVLREGRLAPAVCASCSVPGVLIPVEWQGRQLVDGGIADNLPVRAARALGADYVIAVNLMGTRAVRLTNPLRVLREAVINLVRRVGGGLDEADCLISPAVEGSSFISTRHRQRLIALGASAAEAKVPQISAALEAKG